MSFYTVEKETLFSNKTHTVFLISNVHVVSGDIMMGKNANVGSTVGVLSGVGSQEDLHAADHIIDRYVDVDLIYYHGLNTVRLFYSTQCW